MNTNTSLFEQAQLAEAAYADLWDDALNSLITNSEDVKAALIADGFSTTQATAFVEQWSVVTHQPDTASDYSSTLFQDKATGAYVLSFRGTAGSADLLTDAGDIVLDGLAMYQIVDLYNEWQRISETGAYQVATFVTLDAETQALQESMLAWAAYYANPYGPLPTVHTVEALLDSWEGRTDLIVDLPSGVVQTIQFELSTDIYTDERATGLGLADEIAASGLTVTGHSLGGHLATAFTRLFEVGESAVTINGAGYPTGLVPGLGGFAETNIANVFGLLGGDPDFNPNDILNLHGSAAIEVVSMDNDYGLVQPGDHQQIFTESYDFDNVIGHGGSQMTDSLAVYDLFIRLSDTLQTATTEVALGNLYAIFNAASNEASGSLEALVNDLGSLFVDNFVEIEKADWDDRDKLYLAIQSITDSGQFQLAENLSASLSVVDLTGYNTTNLSSLTALAQTDIAYRYALTELNPFAITGDATLYDAHNSNGELDLYDPATGTGNLTEQYLARDGVRLLVF